MTQQQPPSPFHKGEQKIQRQLGVRARMEQFGQKVIRDYLPEQHRAFYQQLSYLLVGHVDKHGWPWASILFGNAGFIASPHNRQLTINTQAILGDPLAQSLQEDTKLGLLGIDLASRRRNRVAAHIKPTKQYNGTSLSRSTHALSTPAKAQPTAQAPIELIVDQAFGNCPKYIQSRLATTPPATTTPSTTLGRTAFNSLDKDALALIANADTFFVSSFIATDSGNDPSNCRDNTNASIGVDISHRGGKPGFIAVNSQGKLTIPDYSGNFHFNTLGNFIENPKAGLLFLDFEKGHLLLLTGSVQVMFNPPNLHDFAGAERLWTFEVHHGLWLKNAMPTTWQLQDYSPFLAKL